MSPCGLYLTRYATKRGKLYLKTVTRKFCKSEETINSNKGWHDIYNGGPNTKAMGSPTEVMIAVITHYNNYAVLPAYSSEAYRYHTQSGIRGSWHRYFEEGWISLYVSIAYYFVPGSITYGNKYEYTVEIRDIEEGIFAVDTAYLELAGWYNSENYAQIVPRGATCKPPVIALPDNDSSTRGGSIPISDLDGSICGIPFDPIVIPGLFDAPIQWPSQSISYPASAFLLQKGSVAPFYPTFYGALVYDLHLKKWGKMKHEYKQLFDYQPINGKQGNIVSFPTFGVEAGLMNASGTIFIFDEFPNDSYIKYGKIGYYRQGFTHCEEIRIQFGSEADAVLTLEASLDGKFQEATLQRSTNLTNVMDGILLANTSARWYNIKVSGIYDLTYLEFRGTQGSRR